MLQKLHLKTKANAIMEYSILLLTVVAFLGGIYYHLKRNIQARVRAETKHELERPIPFLWQASVTATRSSSDFDRTEQVGGDVEVRAEQENTYVALYAPPPPGMNAAGIHSQDAAWPPPMQDNPEHQMKRDNRRVRPRT